MTIRRFMARGRYGPEKGTRNDSIVAHAILPEVAELAPERFADAARVVEIGDSIAQECQDASSDLRVEMTQVFLR